MSEEYQRRIRTFFEKLTADNLQVVDDFYHPEVHFKDPLTDLQGRESLRKYYQHIYQPVKFIAFDFKEFIIESDRVSAFWDMHLEAPKLNSGQRFTVAGLSHLHFDPMTKLVIFHQDYYDLGEFIYEQIPILKTVIKSIKKRLANHPA